MESNEITQSSEALLLPLTLVTAGESLATTETVAPSPLPTDGAQPLQFTDKRTLQLIRDFLSAEKKDLGPSEVAFLVALLAFKAIDHPVTHSQQTFAQMIGCDVRTIQRIEDKLAAREFIFQNARRGCSKHTMVNLEKLPTVEDAPTQPTEAAKELAGAYANAVDRLFPSMQKKRRKTWAKSNIWNAQKILNRCGDDLGLAGDMVLHALRSPQHKPAASMSLYKLFGRWASVEKSYKASIAAKKQAAQEEQAREQAAQPAMQVAADVQFTEGDE
jgi:hypothetical protein